MNKETLNTKEKYLHIWFNEDYDLIQNHKRIPRHLDIIYGNVLRSFKFRREIHTIIPCFCSREYYDLGFKILIHLYNGKIVEINPHVVKEIKEKLNIKEDLSWEEMLFEGYFGPIQEDQLSCPWETKGKSKNEGKFYSIIDNDDLEGFIELDYVSRNILQTCAHYNAVKIAEYIIDNKLIDIDYRGIGSAINTPFVHACNECNIEMMKLLKDKGADIHLSHNITINKFRENSEEIIEFLEQNNIDYALESFIGDWSVGEC